MRQFRAATPEGSRPGTFEDARAKWSEVLAKGRLGVVRVEGKDDRLVANTTINGCTESVVQFEKVMNPQVSDVEAGVNRDQRTDEMVAFSADVKGAHKSCRLRTSDHGLMLFECMDILYYYLVCHFGGAWSSYWWPEQEERCIAYSMC